MQQPDARADDLYRVETPERIDLEYDVAGLGSRLAAAVVDTAVLGSAAGLVAVLGTVSVSYAFETLARLVGVADPGPDSVLWALAIIVVLTFGVVWGYYVFFELVWHGQSPGKRWIGLRVIKEGGYPIGFGDSAIRNLIRIIDFLPFNYTVGAVVMLLDRRSRRLGDLAAGTLVVKERRDLKVETLALDLNRRLEPGGAERAADLARPEIPNVDRLTPADHSLLREYLLRRQSLDDRAAAALAARLAAAFARRLDHDRGGEPPELFLARLARQLGERD
mgnify:CR=1 FL=1